MPPTVGYSTGTDGGGGATTSGGSEGPITLNGDLWLFTDDGFELTRARPFDELANIFGLDGNSSVVTAGYDGNQFELSGLGASAGTWVLVVPEDADAEAMPTLRRVDTRESRSESLGLVSRRVLDEIFVSLTGQPVVDPERAQLIYRFLDENELPIPGVQVNLDSAEFIAYDDGTGWSDTLQSTGPRGLALLGNVPAGEFPVSAVSVTVNGAVVGEQVLSSSQGTATVELFVAE